jgi:membrane-bound inhibitor of C-type lysozyme
MGPGTTPIPRRKPASCGFSPFALLALLLAACQSQSPGSTVIAGTYECDGGKTFSFTTEQGSETITLQLEGNSYSLQQQPVAGRTQYSDGELAFWTERGGRFATLDGTTEPYRNCEAVAWQGDSLG